MFSIEVMRSTRSAIHSDSVNGKKRFGIIVSIDLENILDDKRFDQGVLDEARKRAKKGEQTTLLEIKTLVREYVENLYTVHHEVRDLISSRVEASEQGIMAAKRRFAEANPANDTALGLAVGLFDKAGHGPHRFLPFWLFGVRGQYIAKNQRPVNLAKRYVSSE